LPDHPDWIPYRTSYYNESWGFCISQKKLDSMNDGTYDVSIDSSLTDGHLTFGEFYIPGSTDQEVLFSCHVCHPSLCNDNLSAISVLTHLAQSLGEMKLRYSYRFLFIPTTIGSITWLALNQEKTVNIKNGLVAANLGDGGDITYKKSRQGNAEIDRIVQIVLRDSEHPYTVKDFFPYGYDERQFCSPGFNLPVGSIMRTPHGEYPEYHTSADNLEFVKPEYLADSYRTVYNIVASVENNKTYKNTNPYCEPQLGKRGIYKHIGGGDTEVDQLALLWVLNMSDGRHSILDIAERSGIRFEQLKAASDLLLQCNLLLEV
jgi:aminopeptidase-like protein